MAANSRYFGRNHGLRARAAGIVAIENLQDSAYRFTVTMTMVPGAKGNLWQWLRFPLAPKSLYCFRARCASAATFWPMDGSATPQSLRSSLGAPAGGGAKLLSMQGIVLRYS